MVGGSPCCGIFMSKAAGTQGESSPIGQMWKLIWPGALAAQVVYVAARLGLIDQVADEAKTVEELASSSGTDAQSLGRLLRALVSLGILVQDQSGRFRATSVGEVLGSSHPSSLRSWTIFLGSPFIWNPWGNLFETISTGQTAFSQLYGMPFFSYLANHPEYAKVFNDAMSAGSSDYVKDLLAAYDFSKFERIVDVGGGQGELLRGILKTNPTTHGVLFDLPAVVAETGILKADTMAGRCEVIAGDFFEEVPQAGDVYILKTIIHSYDDEDALRILKVCRRAIKENGRLLLLEIVLTAASKPGSALMDMMDLVLGGRERTEEEFGKLLSRAGFSLLRVIPARNFSILESRPV